MKFTFFKNTPPGQQLWRATGTGIKLSLLFETVNELELSITFRWMANTKLTEQYVFCYITSIVQPYAPELALQRRHSHHCCLFWLRVASLVSSTHLSCDPWACPRHNVLSYLLPPCSLHEVKSCISLLLRVLLIGRYSWICQPPGVCTAKSLSLNMSLMLAFA